MEIGPENWASKQNEDTSFTFLTVEPQKEHERPRLSAGVRKQMKSHLTILQHKRVRQEKAARISGWLTSSLGRQKEANVEAKAKEEVAGRSSPCVRVPRVEQGWALSEREDEVELAEASSKRRMKSSTFVWQLPTGVLEQSFSRGSMAFRTFALDDPSNVIGSSLSRIQLDISSVLVSHVVHCQIAKQLSGADHTLRRNSTTLSSTFK